MLRNAAGGSTVDFHGHLCRDSSVALGAPNRVLRIPREIAELLLRASDLNGAFEFRPGVGFVHNTQTNTLTCD